MFFLDQWFFPTKKNVKKKKITLKFSASVSTSKSQICSLILILVNILLKLVKVCILGYFMVYSFRLFEKKP